MENTFKAIIFDMGEVLVKTIDRTPRSHLANQFGLTFEELELLVYFSDSALQAMSGEITENVHFKSILKQLGNPNISILEFKEAFWGGDDIDHALISFITSIKNRFKLGLLSNAMDTTRQRLSEKYNLIDYFDASIFSCEVKIAKPKAEIYHLILSQLNVKPQKAIFVDDFIENIEAANKLGLTTILHKSTPQTIEHIIELTNLE